MRYRLILLKDLPEYPAGTIFKLYELRERRGHSTKPGLVYDVGILRGDEYVTRTFEQDFIDNPTWFRKEIDPDLLCDLKCPKCGRTQGNFFSGGYYERDMDCDDYGLQYSVGFECLCGFKRILYGTHYGNQFLCEKEKLEVAENAKN